MKKIISLWSGPRNVSTALMYSFAQRADTKVIDEPLYAHYLKVTDVEHPGREEVLQAMENDGEKVVQQIILKESPSQITFIKNMAHHLVNLDESFLYRLENIFLIRDPQEMLPSLVNQIPNPTLRDTALADQAKLFQKLKDSGKTPTVIDSKELLLNPKQILTQLCRNLGIPFSEKMLSWKKGALAEDGVWAKYWYHNVHKSISFAPYRKKQEKVKEDLLPLLSECSQHYDFLYNFALKTK